VPALVITED